MPDYTPDELEKIKLAKRLQKKGFSDDDIVKSLDMWDMRKQGMSKEEIFAKMGGGELKPAPVPRKSAPLFPPKKRIPGELVPGMTTPFQKAQGQARALKKVTFELGRSAVEEKYEKKAEARLARGLPRGLTVKEDVEQRKVKGATWEKAQERGTLEKSVPYRKFIDPIRGLQVSAARAIQEGDRKAYRAAYQGWINYMYESEFEGQLPTYGNLSFAEIKTQGVKEDKPELARELRLPRWQTIDEPSSEGARAERKWTTQLIMGSPESEGQGVARRLGLPIIAKGVFAATVDIPVGMAKGLYDVAKRTGEGETGVPAAAKELLLDPLTQPFKKLGTAFGGTELEKYEQGERIAAAPVTFVAETALELSPMLALPGIPKIPGAVARTVRTKVAIMKAPKIGRLIPKASIKKLRETKANVIAKPSPKTHGAFRIEVEKVFEEMGRKVDADIGKISPAMTKRQQTTVNKNLEILDRAGALLEAPEAFEFFVRKYGSQRLKEALVDGHSLGIIPAKVIKAKLREASAIKGKFGRRKGARVTEEQIKAASPHATNVSEGFFDLKEIVGAKITAYMKESPLLTRLAEVWHRYHHKKGESFWKFDKTSDAGEIVVKLIEGKKELMQTSLLTWKKQLKRASKTLWTRTFRKLTKEQRKLFKKTITPELLREAMAMRYAHGKRLPADLLGKLKGEAGVKFRQIDKVLESWEGGLPKELQPFANDIAVMLDSARLNGKGIWGDIYENPSALGGMENYYPQLVLHYAKEGGGIGGAFRRTTPYGKERLMRRGVLEGAAEGHVYVIDPMDVIPHYVSSTSTALGNVQALKALKNIELLDGVPAMIKASDKNIRAYPTYKKIKHSAFEHAYGREPALVHPDIANYISNYTKPSGVRAFEAFGGVPLGEAILKINYVSKMGKVAFGVWHHRALVVQAIAGMLHGPKAFFKGLDNLKKNSAIAKHALDSGALKIGAQQDYAFNLLSKTGFKTIDTLKNLGFNQWNAALWDSLFPALKTSVFEIEFLRNLKKLRKRKGFAELYGEFEGINKRFLDKKGKISGEHVQAYKDALNKRKLTRFEAEVMDATSYVNDNFGGLNWRRMGWSRTAQDALRLATFAPDWTYSNFRMFFGAIKGMPGMKMPQYRPAAVYFVQTIATLWVLANMTNFALRGEGSWKDMAPQGEKEPMERYLARIVSRQFTFEMLDGVRVQIGGHFIGEIAKMADKGILGYGGTKIPGPFLATLKEFAFGQTWGRWGKYHAPIQEFLKDFKLVQGHPGGWVQRMPTSAIIALKSFFPFWAQQAIDIHTGGRQLSTEEVLMRALGFMKEWEPETKKGGPQQRTPPREKPSRRPPPGQK